MQINEQPVKKKTTLNNKQMYFLYEPASMHKIFKKMKSLFFNIYYPVKEFKNYSSKTNFKKWVEERKKRAFEN